MSWTGRLVVGACAVGILATAAMAATPRERAASGSSLSGLYHNLVPDVVVAVESTVVCWAGGARTVEVLPAGAGTAGSACAPGEVGFLVENEERAALDWWEAKEVCTAAGQRLAEPFEFFVACEAGRANGVASFTDDTEWAVNSPAQFDKALMAGGSTCDMLSYSAVAGWPAPFRCFR